MKIYEYRNDTMSQHLPNTAIITRSKFLTETSTYMGGTNTYVSSIEVKLPFKKRFRKAWETTEQPNKGEK